MSFEEWLSVFRFRNRPPVICHTSSFIQTLLLVLELHQIGAEAFADCTASREFHPALKTCLFKCCFYCISLDRICQALLSQPDHLVDGALGLEAQFLRKLDLLAALAFQRPIDVHKGRKLHVGAQKVFR